MGQGGSGSTAEDDAPRREQLFTVRIWSEGTGDAGARRGSVRAVRSGAFRNFRAWPDLVSFLEAQMDEAR
jgi:hypothetical protein